MNRSNPRSVVFAFLAGMNLVAGVLAQPYQLTFSASGPAQTAYGGQTLTVVADDTVYFNANYNGPVQPTAYEWRKDGVSLGVTTSFWFSVRHAQLADAGRYTVAATVGLDKLVSSPITVSMVDRLRISQSPLDPILLGSSLTLTAVAPAGMTLAEIVWRFEGKVLEGATSATLNLSGVGFSAAGSYQVAATYVSLGRRIYSEDHELKVYPSLQAPVIVSQPQPRTGHAGGQAVFTVGASGAAPFSYQWRRDGLALPNATNFYLALRDLKAGDAGQYSVVVSNVKGTATSGAAGLVLAPLHTPAASVSNLVVLARARLAEQTKTSLSAAAVAFVRAASEDPQYELAHLYAAATRVFDLAHQPAANQLLDRLLFSAQGRDLYDWTAEPMRDARDKTVVPPGVNASEVTAYLRDAALPELRAAAANLSAIKDDAFSAWVPAVETAMSDVTLDQGDVQALRALLLWFEWLIRTLNSWDLSAQLKTFFDLAAHDRGTLEEVLRDYPQLLTYADVAQVAPARAAFEAAVDAYVQAAGLIYARQGTVRKLFNLEGGDDFEHEAQVRQVLLDTKASLARATVMNLRPEFLANASPFFDGLHAPRTLLPSFVGNRPDPATMPEPFLAGIVRYEADAEIVLQPLDQVGSRGQAAVLGVAAVGAEPLFYQWSHNGQIIPGATSRLLHLTNLQPGDEGAYSVFIFNTWGFKTSHSAALAVLGAPTIQRQPLGQVLTVGSRMRLSVEATGAEPLSYQWSFDGRVLPGANAPTLELSAAQATNAGNYAVSVSNAFGSAVSEAVNVRLFDKFFHRVGQLPSGTNSQIRAASVDGAIAVGNANTGDGYYKPIIWRAGRGLELLPMLPNAGTSRRFVTASDITPDGATIAGRSLDGSGNNRQAVLWRSDGNSVVGLGNLAGGQLSWFGAAVAISDDGQVVYGWTTTPNRFQEAFRWTAATGLIPLGPNDQSVDLSSIFPRAVSADGRVAAGSLSRFEGETVADTAFRYTSSEGIESLGVLPGGANSYAGAVTADGSMIYGWSDSSDGSQLFRWTETDGLEALGKPEGFSDVVQLWGATADGGAVALYAQPNVADTNLLDQVWVPAMIWNAHGFVEVEQVLQSAGLDLQGLSDLGLLGLSDSGCILWGDGLDAEGRREGWVAAIPAGLAQSAVPVPSPPVFLFQPVSQAAEVGQTVVFRAYAINLPAVPPATPVAYQWTFRGNAIAGATNSSYEIPSVQARHQGDYAVVASNSAGARASLVASLNLPGVQSLWLLSPQRLPSGAVQVLLSGGQPGRRYTLEASTNLTAWAGLVTTPFATDPLSLSDLGAASFPRRFYRVKLEP